MKRKKIIGIIAGIIAVTILTIGITFAIWPRSTDIIGDANCFDITYSGTGFDGVLQMSGDYTGGITSTVRMKISDRCPNVKGTGVIYLNTTSFTKDSNSILTGNVATEPLKYAVLLQGDPTPLAEGVITATGDIPIYGDPTINPTTNNDSGFVLATSNQAEQVYVVYVWLDGDFADENYMGAVYNGYIHVSARQSG